MGGTCSIHGDKKFTRYEDVD